MKIKCEECNGYGKSFFGRKKYNCLYCGGKGYLNDSWDKEFEKEVCCLDDLFEIGDKYLFGRSQLYTKIKIKCKKGCIQIERI